MLTLLNSAIDILRNKHKHVGLVFAIVFTFFPHFLCWSGWQVRSYCSHPGTILLDTLLQLPLSPTTPEYGWDYREPAPAYSKYLPQDLLPPAPGGCSGTQFHPVGIHLKDRIQKFFNAASKLNLKGAAYLLNSQFKVPDGISVILQQLPCVVEQGNSRIRMRLSRACARI